MASEKDLKGLLQRLAELERQNYRFKCIGSAVCLLAALVLLAAQAAPESKTVQAESFVLKDSAGKTRATWSVSNEGPALNLIDEADKQRIAIALGRSGPIVALLDENGRE